MASSDIQDDRKSEGSKNVRIRTYLHEKPQKTKTDMYKFAPRNPRLQAPNRNKPTQIRTPSWKTPQRRTYSRRGVQIRVGSEPTEKRGVEFKGGSLHDGFGGFDGFGGPAEHLALLSIVLQNTGPRSNRDGFDGFGGFSGCGGFGRDGYPP